MMLEQYYFVFMKVKAHRDALWTSYISLNLIYLHLSGYIICILFSYLFMLQIMSVHHKNLNRYTFGAVATENSCSYRLF